MKAVASELWDLIDPDAEGRASFTRMPVPPKVENYDKRRIQRETRSASSSTATSSGPQEEEVDIGAHLKTTAEMTIVACTAFQLDWNMYTYNSRLYTQEKEVIEKIKDWTLKTVVQEASSASGGHRSQATKRCKRALQDSDKTYEQSPQGYARLAEYLGRGD